MNNEILTIKTEYGKENKFEVVDKIKLDSNEYVILSPVGSDLAYAYKTSINNGFIEYESLSIGSEFKKVLKEYNNKNEK